MTKSSSVTPSLQPGEQPAASRRYAAVGLFAIVVTGVLAWSYGGTLLHLAGRWSGEDDYSHGFFVPIFSCVLLYLRRDLMPAKFAASNSSVICGVGLLVLAGLIRVASAYLFYELLDPVSLIPAFLGIALILGGWEGLRWAWPSIVFLGFMIPLPGFIADRLSHPLQRIGTIASTYLMQTVGVPAAAEGNVIWLSNGEIGVEEACSGLRMLNVFFAITVGAAFIVKRPFWERVVIVLSAPIIGILVNVLRITATGIAHETAGAEVADKIFHDFAGLLMMPAAIAFLLIECGILNRLLLAPHTEPMVIQRQQTPQPAAEQSAASSG